MKKIILATSFLLFFFQFGITQIEPRLQKYITSLKSIDQDTFMVTKEESYEYDFFNNITLKETKEYDPLFSIYMWNGIFYEYSPNQLLKKETLKRYNPDVDLWIVEYFIDHKYDTNNCLIESIRTVNSGGGIQLKEEYILDENCQWIFKHVSFPSFANDTIFESYSETDRIYFSDGISYEEKYLNYFSPNLNNSRSFFFNEKGQIIETRTISSNPTRESKNTIEYDQFDNILIQTSFSRLSDTLEWKLNNIRNYINEYDEHEFLIRKREEFTSYQTTASDWVKESKYKNTCEGIPEMVELESLEYGYKVKEEFIYEGIDRCIDLNNIDLNIQVFPNPSNGIFNIFSSIFQTGNTEIIVYSIDGKALLQKTEFNRSTSSLDLSFLPNGFYVLEFGNGNHFVKEKIVIAK